MLQSKYPSPPRKLSLYEKLDALPIGATLYIPPSIEVELDQISLLTKAPSQFPHGPPNPPRRDAVALPVPRTPSFTFAVARKFLRRAA